MMGPSGTNPVRIDSQGNHVEPSEQAQCKLCGAVFPGDGGHDCDVLGRLAAAEQKIDAIRRRLRSRRAETADWLAHDIRAILDDEDTP